MTRILINVLLICCAASGLSCAVEYYKPPESAPRATVSFSNLTPEKPEIYITRNCISLPVHERLIENKKTYERAKYETAIPANETITFRYVYDLILHERTAPVTSGSFPSNWVELKKTTSPSSCTSLISFTPEANRHYEVFFGLVGEECEINAKELLQTSDTGQTFRNVVGTKAKDCPK